jgi:hypothetical protein
VNAGSDGVDRARAECCVSGAQNEVPVCVCLCLSEKSVSTVPTYSVFSKSTVKYFGIIGAFFADNGKGVYPGLLRTEYALNSFVY